MLFFLVAYGGQANEVLWERITVLRQKTNYCPRQHDMTTVLVDSFQQMVEAVHGRLLFPFTRIFQSVSILR